MLWILYKQLIMLYINHFKTTLIEIIFKILIPASQTRSLSIIGTTLLMLFTGNNSCYSENHAKHINAICGQN
jgi:hypothetical protein